MLRGWVRGSICICARLSIWKTPVVSAARIDSKVCSSSSAIRERSSGSPRRARRLRRRSARPPRASPAPAGRSSGSRRRAQESLSHWTIWRPSIAAGTTGQTSISGSVEITIPPECWEAWRGRPSASAAEPEQRLPARRGGALGADRGDDVALDLRRGLVEADRLRHPARSPPAAAPAPCRGRGRRRAGGRSGRRRPGPSGRRRSARARAGSAPRGCRAGSRGRCPASRSLRR